MLALIPNNKISAPPLPFSRSPLRQPSVQRACSIRQTSTCSEAGPHVPDARGPSMAPTLKPLLLPQLVEARKKLELQQDDEGELVSVYYAYNSSASDLASPSPISSTFSRTGLPRFSGSTSSLELATPSFFDSPPPPTQTQPLHGSRNSKPLLPDVQEEPLERDAEDAPAAFDHGYHDFGLYDCLCR